VSFDDGLPVEDQGLFFALK